MNILLFGASRRIGRRIADELLPLVRAHNELLELYRDVDDIGWWYIDPAAVIKPGERTGEHRIADGRRDGRSPRVTPRELPRRHLEQQLR